MNVSSSTSVGNQYLSSTSTQRAHHKHSSSNNEKNQDTVEFSAEAREKYAQSQGNLSSDFDPITELSAAKPSDSEASGSGRPVGGPPHGGPPPGGPPPSGGAHGKSSSSTDNADTVKDLLAALTDEADTNGDGVVDEKDEQTTASKAVKELNSNLDEALS